MAPRQTKRQRECARIASEKAKKMRRRQVVRRCVLLFGGIALLYAAGGGFWFVHTGRAAQFVDNRQHDFYKFCCGADKSQRSATAARMFGDGYGI